MTSAPDPIRPTDDEARALAQRLIREARFAALGTLDPESGFPAVSRIALGLGPKGGLWCLISSLAAHSRALHADPRAGLLLGEPGPRGDPLTHPRLSLRAQAIPLPRDDPRHPALRAHWLKLHPKAQLYIDFGDFQFIRFRPLDALLNGGFGRAFRLSTADLALEDHPDADHA